MRCAMSRMRVSGTDWRNSPEGGEVWGECGEGRVSIGLSGVKGGSNQRHTKHSGGLEKAFRKSGYVQGSLPLIDGNRACMRRAAITEAAVVVWSAPRAAAAPL